MDTKKQENSIIEISKNLLVGLKTTIKTFFNKPVTFQYPRERLEIAERFRAFPKLNVNKDGSLRCVACFLCQTVCPSEAIKIKSGYVDYGDNHELTERQKHNHSLDKLAHNTFNDGRRHPSSFDIDLLRCICCGYCEEICPEEAISMGSNYEVAFYTRDEGIYGVEKLIESR
ncbi:MAG: NADH-quinone oxidoreductase subunit I [Candidatus Acidulodesulfobacterium ferriphilum]|uniref:NADH-quinone oxidoreductase subunit I n=1 Tax=Candidatus Acidulodesulfobacterium ferriphilum TaxID=2597223 RepID=A0A519BCN3_9DELT|nr:MAG: NADH-quinone oxidoreductase subunit I [Candidatus Acidulodesulfobacterium ferriphilum]